MLAELCRTLDACERAVLCASSHGQLEIDGYVVRPQHLDRWTPAQLQGRYAKIYSRTAQLYGPTVAGR